jgi:simple sugar transport system permease protein
MAVDLPRLVPTRLHAGVILAVIFAILAWFLLWKTTIGFRIRAVGLNPRASRRAGIRVERYAALAMLLSGALAGLGGAVQVLGVNHRMFTDGSAMGFTGSAGFNGIVAALFGQLHPLGTIPASVLFGAMLVGANKMQRAVQVPSALITALNGLVVIFVVGSEILRRTLARRREMSAAMMEPAALKPISPGSGEH